MVDEKNESEELQEEPTVHMYSVGSLGMSDLYALYLFTSAQANNISMNLDAEIKDEIRSRNIEVEAELSRRAFGFVVSEQYTKTAKRHGIPTDRFSVTKNEEE